MTMTKTKMKMKTKTKTTRTRPFDAARYLSSDDDVSAYLDAVLEDGDPRVIGQALGEIARAKGMTKIARATGMSRESLYKALSPDGNPEMATFLKVIRAFGLQLHTSEV